MFSALGGHAPRCRVASQGRFTGRSPGRITNQVAAARARTLRPVRMARGHVQRARAPCRFKQCASGRSAASSVRAQHAAAPHNNNNTRHGAVLLLAMPSHSAAATHRRARAHTHTRTGGRALRPATRWSKLRESAWARALRPRLCAPACFPSSPSWARQGWAGHGGTAPASFLADRALCGHPQAARTQADAARSCTCRKQRVPAGRL